MAISEANSGVRITTTPPEANFTALGGVDNTDDGVYQLFLDCQQMQRGDTIEVRVRESVLSGNTANVIFESTMSNVQDEPIFVSPSMILLHKWTFEMRQTAGSVRAFNWSLRKVA